MPIPMKKPNSTKFWNFNVVNDGVTELLLYSDIADAQSMDWWTGESGDEVTPKLFMQELNGITTPEICVRINSNGGSVFAANVIATHLKETIAKGKKVTCKIDGVCASSAVIVAFSCEKIAIPSSAYMMIHNPMNVLYGLFNADEMRKLADTLDTIKTGIINEYVRRTGLPEAECSKLMDDETWMDGKTAVEKGFADELMFADDQTVLNTIKLAFVNKAICPPKALQDALNNIKPVEGEKIMEIKNLADMKNQFPDFVNEAETAANTAGASAERARMQALDKLQGKVPQDILNKAKYETFESPEKVALDCMTNGTFVNSAVINALEADAASANGVSGTANPELDAGDEKAIKNKQALDFVQKAAKEVVDARGGK